MYTFDNYQLSINNIKSEILTMTNKYASFLNSNSFLLLPYNNRRKNSIYIKFCNFLKLRLYFCIYMQIVINRCCLTFYAELSSMNYNE